MIWPKSLSLWRLSTLQSSPLKPKINAPPISVLTQDSAQKTRSSSRCTQRTQHPSMAIINQPPRQQSLKLTTRKVPAVFLYQYREQRRDNEKPASSSQIVRVLPQAPDSQPQSLQEPKPHKLPRIMKNELPSVWQLRLNGPRTAN